MEEEYPEVVSTWEYATMEMETLQMQIQHKKKRKQQIDDKLEKMKTSIESKGNSLDEEMSLQEEKSLQEESLKLEEKIDLLKFKISIAVECEKNAQICFSKEVFSDVSLKCIQQTCEQMSKDLMFKLTNDQIEKDATLKKIHVNPTSSEKQSLSKKIFQLAENIEHHELEMRTKAKVTSLFNILHSGISVDCQWYNAVQKVKELATTIAMLDRKLEELPVSKLTEEKQQKQDHEDTIRDLKLEQEKELKTISTFESIFSKIVLNQSCENENNTKEEQENVPEKQTTQTMNKRRSIKKNENSNEREDNRDKKEHKLGKVNSSGVEEKVEEIQSKTNNLELTDESEHRNNPQEDREILPGKLSTQTVNKIENSENVNEEEDDIDKEERELQEVNPVKGAEAQVDDIQGKKSCSRLTDERFQNEFGIIIESKYEKDLSYDAEPWHCEERLEVLDSKAFPVNFKLYTDIFHISESTAEIPHEGIRVPAKDVRFKLLLAMQNSTYYEYKVAIKVGKSWTLIDYSIQDGFMVFEVDHVESFCVLSLLREEKHIILPAGSQFISEIDNRIQVSFPPFAVTKEEHITFKIHPANISCILKRTTGSINNSISINAITPGISTVHMKFKKMFKVQLPLDYIIELCGNKEDYIYYIFKMNDGGSFESTDIQPSVSNGLVCFEANSFSGLCCVGTTRSNRKSSIGPVLQEGYGFKKWCKILFFVGTLRNYALPIMLECVTLDRVSDVCKAREKCGYQFVTEWTGKDFLLSPDETIITVDVKGIFRIPKDSGVKHPRLSLVPVAEENFTRFLVEVRKGCQLQYGMLVLREQNKRKILDEFYYHPYTTKKCIPAKPRGNRGKEPLVTEKLPIGTHQILKDFFTEKGLLALSKSMSPDTMMEVCIYMDMTTPTYEIIRQKHTNTTMQNIELWKAALNQQPDNKLQNLIQALVQSGQKSLADKVQKLYSNGEDLHTI